MSKRRATPTWKDLGIGREKSLVGPHFQPVLPMLISVPDYKELDTTKWLGIKVWPLKNKQLDDDDTQTNRDAIGRGRADSCECQIPGSSVCIKKHVEEEKTRVNKELGPAFYQWKFNKMGEGASRNWTIDERQEFEAIEENSPASKGKSFLDAALQAFPNHNRACIISYYYNIIVPKKLSRRIRSGCSFKEVHTDDEVNKTSLSSSSTVSSSHTSPKKKAKPAAGAKKS